VYEAWNQLKITFRVLVTIFSGLANPNDVGHAIVNGAQSPRLLAVARWSRLELSRRRFHRPSAVEYDRKRSQEVHK
jgi:hypothetical protein